MYISKKNHFLDRRGYDHDDYQAKRRPYQTDNVDDKSYLEKLLYEQERLLWLHVIIQAVYDAKNIATDKKMRREKTRALMWLSLTNKDFIFVCEMAVVDPVYILRGIKKYLQNTIKQRRKQKRKTQLHYKKQANRMSGKSSLLYRMIEVNSKVKN